MTQQLEKDLAFNTICDRLLEVLNQGASFCAFSTAWLLIWDAYDLMQERFPVGVVFSDGDQGIEITWTLEEFDNSGVYLINELKKVQLLCSATSDKCTYLYYELDDKTNVLHDVSALTLACWLQWLNISKTQQDQNTLTINK